jgi:hypothetical protein
VKDSPGCGFRTAASLIAKRFMPRATITPPDPPSLP